MTDKVSAPDTDTFDHDGSLLYTFVTAVIGVRNGPVVVAPENFTDYQTPQTGSSIQFG